MKHEISTHVAKINNLEAGSAVYFPDGNMNLFLKLGKNVVQVKLFKIKKNGKRNTTKKKNFATKPVLA